MHQTPELEPHAPGRPWLEAPRIRQCLHQLEAEPTEAALCEPWKDQLYVARRRRLLHLDTDVGIIGLDPEDQLRVGLQPSMAHRVAHQFAEGEPGVIRSPVERWGRDSLVQGSSGYAPGALVHREDHFSS